MHIQPNSTQLPDLAIEAPAGEEGYLAAPIIEKVVGMCQKHPMLAPFLDFRFRRCTGTILLFDREIPGHCKLCNRVHDNDGMYIGLSGNKVYAACHGFGHGAYADFKANMTQCQYIGKLPWTAPMIAAWSIWEGGGKPADQLVCEMPNVTVYDEEKVRDYDFSKGSTLLVRSAVGTEKTKALIRYMEAENPERVVVISFRKAFTEENIGKLPGFFDYRETDGNIDNARAHKHVIIQFESMHRLNCPKDNPPDLLVLDEIESIMDQMEHNVMKKQNTLAKVLAVFAHVMRFSKKVIAMDAFLGERSIALMKSLRPEESIASQDNHHQSKKDDKFFLLPPEMLYKLATSAVGKGEPIVIVSNTKRFARGINEHLTGEFPDKKIRLYTGDNSCEKEVREELRNVNEAWKDLDVLIYTSTVLAGCSFEQTRFKYCFAHFSDSTVTAQGCLQMLGRVRDISSKEYYISFADNTCENDRHMQSEEEIDATIEAHFNRTKAHWDKEFGKEARLIAEVFAEMVPGESMSVEINQCGIPITTIDKDWWYYAHVRNIAHVNCNRNHFIREFLRLLRIQGCGLDVIEDANEVAPDARQWGEVVATTRDLAEWKVAEEIAKAPNSTPEEADKLMKVNAVNTHEDHIRVEKIKFANFYGIEQDSFDTVDVLDYSRDNVKREYANLKHISKEVTIEASLLRMEKGEAAMMHRAKSKADILAIRNRSEKHRVALGLIELAGWNVLAWKCPFNTEDRLSTEQVIQNIDDKLTDYVERNADALHTLFGKRKKALQKVGTMGIHNKMQFINGLLQTFYGVRISNDARAAGAYAVRSPTHFKYEKDRYWPLFYNRQGLTKTMIPERAHAAIARRVTSLTAIERKLADWSAREGVSDIAELTEAMIKGARCADAHGLEYIVPTQTC